MKKLLLWGVISVLGLALACGPLDENGDVTEGVDGTVDGTGGGDGTQQLTYSWVLIQDELTDTEACTTNPGADIDAVQLYRGGEEIATAGGNPIFHSGNVCETNTASDPSKITGEPDEDNPEDSNNLFLSLNGGYVLFQMFESGSTDPVVFQNGDTLQVYEVFNPDNSDKTKEGYQVYICPDSSGDTSQCKYIGEGKGDGTFTVNL